MSEKESSPAVLQFAPLNSCVQESFWLSFSSLKLKKLRLDDSPISITGFCGPCSHPQVSKYMTLLSESLPLDEQSSTSHGNRNKCPVPGIFYNTNTLESFKKRDRQSLLKAEANKIWDDIQSGKALDDPAVLSRFLVTSFADLKKWSFCYWFAFPALVLDPPACLVELKPASEYFSSEEAESVSAACNEWRNSADVPFFLVSVSSDSKASIRHLKDWEACQGDHQKLLFGFYVPCNLPNIPGWPLRNYLALIRAKWNLETVWFFCYKERRGFADLNLSLVGQASVTLPSGEPAETLPDAVGWELYKGKSVPRSISLANSMDPIRMAVYAVDLNLQLMTWRASPSLNLKALSSAKCLLLGAGTLGCEVARTLMGWGIRNITFVDYGRVAMSNPVKQSLYTFKDCIGDGEFKAVAAVKRVKEIFPAMESSGVVMAIPMPGHPISSQEEDSVLADCKRLSDLIESHDAVFLLTDTRESRWLPSLLCANANKIAINAALGFDNYMVMRHGAGPTSLSGDMQSLDMNKTNKERLGCYFCNDVVEPQDSMTDRTLDQQCTVTWPGLADTAGARAVDLLVKVLHHPLGINAKGDNSSLSNGGNNGDDSPLGNIPHQIRGSVYNFSQMTLLGQASDSCTACSETVISEYRERGNSFILEAINHPTYLEDLTGLTELKNAANSFNLDWEDDDTDDGDDDVAVDM